MKISEKETNLLESCPFSKNEKPSPEFEKMRTQAVQERNLFLESNPNSLECKNQYFEKRIREGITNELRVQLIKHLSKRCEFQKDT